MPEQIAKMACVLTIRMALKKQAHELPWQSAGSGND
jgi:hypothetical protein